MTTRGQLCAGGASAPLVRDERRGSPDFLEAVAALLSPAEGFSSWDCMATCHAMDGLSPPQDSSAVADPLHAGAPRISTPSPLPRLPELPPCGQLLPRWEVELSLPPPRIPYDGEALADALFNTVGATEENMRNFLLPCLVTMRWFLTTAPRLGGRMADRAIGVSCPQSEHGPHLEDLGPLPLLLPQPYMPEPTAPNDTTDHSAPRAGPSPVLCEWFPTLTPLQLLALTALVADAAAAQVPLDASTAGASHVGDDQPRASSDASETLAPPSKGPQSRAPSAAEIYALQCVPRPGITFDVRRQHGSRPAFRVRATGKKRCAVGVFASLDEAVRALEEHYLTCRFRDSCRPFSGRSTKQTLHHHRGAIARGRPVNTLAARYQDASVISIRKSEQPEPPPSPLLPAALLPPRNVRVGGISLLPSTLPPRPTTTCPLLAAAEAGAPQAERATMAATELGGVTDATGAARVAGVDLVCAEAFRDCLELVEDDAGHSLEIRFLPGHSVSLDVSSHTDVLGILMALQSGGYNPDYFSAEQEGCAIPLSSELAHLPRQLWARVHQGRYRRIEFRSESGATFEPIACGLSTTVADAIEALQKRGCEVDFLTCSGASNHHLSCNHLLHQVQYGLCAGVRGRGGVRTPPERPSERCEAPLLGESERARCTQALFYIYTLAHFEGRGVPPNVDLAQQRPLRKQAVYVTRIDGVELARGALASIANWIRSRIGSGNYALERTGNPARGSLLLTGATRQLKVILADAVMEAMRNAPRVVLPEEAEDAALLRVARAARGCFEEAALRAAQAIDAGLTLDNFYAHGAPLAQELCVEDVGTRERQANGWLRPDDCWPGLVPTHNLGTGAEPPRGLLPWVHDQERAVLTLTGALLQPFSWEARCQTYSIFSRARWHEAEAASRLLDDALTELSQMVRHGVAAATQPGEAEMDYGARCASAAMPHLWLLASKCEHTLQQLDVDNSFFPAVWYWGPQLFERLRVNLVRTIKTARLALGSNSTPNLDLSWESGQQLTAMLEGCVRDLASYDRHNHILAPPFELVQGQDQAWHTLLAGDRGLRGQDGRRLDETALLAMQTSLTVGQLVRALSLRPGEVHPLAERALDGLPRSSSSRERPPTAEPKGSPLEDVKPRPAHGSLGRHQLARPPRNSLLRVGTLTPPIWRLEGWDAGIRAGLVSPWEVRSLDDMQMVVHLGANIGAGKSTALELLRETARHAGAALVPEPVDLWPLEAHYSGRLASIGMQMVVGATIQRQLAQALDGRFNQGCPPSLICMERSLSDGCHVFTPLGITQPDELSAVALSYAALADALPAHLSADTWLDVEPSLACERCSRRERSSERSLPPSLFDEIQRFYDEHHLRLAKAGRQVYSIDGRQSPTKVAADYWQLGRWLSGQVDALVPWSDGWDHCGRTRVVGFVLPPVEGEQRRSALWKAVGPLGEMPLAFSTAPHAAIMAGPEGETQLLRMLASSSTKPQYDRYCTMPASGWAAGIAETEGATQSTDGAPEEDQDKSATPGSAALRWYQETNSSEGAEAQGADWGEDADLGAEWAPDLPVGGSVGQWVYRAEGPPAERLKPPPRTPPADAPPSPPEGDGDAAQQPQPPCTLAVPQKWLASGLLSGHQPDTHSTAKRPRGDESGWQSSGGLTNDPTCNHYFSIPPSCTTSMCPASAAGGAAMDDEAV